MKRWYCEQCGIGPYSTKSYSCSSGLTVCRNCFFTGMADRALKRHFGQTKEKIFLRVLRQDRPYYEFVGKWLDTCCQIDPAHWTPSKELYTSYTAWCATNGHKLCNGVAFKRLLEDYGLPVIHHRGIQGLHLINP